MEHSLKRSLASAGIDDTLNFVRFTQLSEYLLAAMPDSPEVLGTVLLLRLEDWLREQLESAPYDAAKDAWVRQEFRLRIEEFVSQLGILARSGKPVWLLPCPSNGWISEQHKLGGLCRTYGNLLLARVRDLPQVHLLSWPASLSASDAADWQGDRTGQRPFTQDAYNKIGEFLGSQVARWFSSQDPNATSSRSSGSSELADYLVRLHVRVELVPAGRSHREPVGHVLRTAASFSLTGENPALSDAEVDALLQSGSCMLVDVSDRLSEYGPAGVVIFRSTGDELAVSSMALICPVLGKQVEYAVLSALSQIAAERHLARIVLAYRPSARNQPMLTFLKATTDEETNHGFVLPMDGADARINKAAAAPGAWSVRVAYVESSR